MKYKPRNKPTSQSKRLFQHMRQTHEQLVKERILTVGKTNQEDNVDNIWGSYPRIRLQGNWLQQAGFNPGDKIEVVCNTESITITKGTK